MENKEILVLVVATVLTVIGFGSLFYMAYIRAVWPRTAGRVVGNFTERSKTAGSKKDFYFAKISFMARNGQTHEVKGEARAQPWQIGERVNLWYKPSNPAHALAMKVWRQLAFSSVFIAMGLACWAKVTGLVS